MSKIHVKGLDITVTQENDEDYICLTDMIKSSDGNFFISDWLRNRNTLDYIALWEQFHNKDFNYGEFAIITNGAGRTSFRVSVKDLTERCNIKSILSKTGRYGGTYAHIDIALHFAMWVSPEFNLLLVTEFKTLKRREATGLDQVWDFRRFLTKANYRIQTDAIQEVLIPLRNLPKKLEGIIYAEEAELLNKVVFNKTAKEWNAENPGLVTKGHNIRDYGTTHQLILIANLEPLNAELIRNKISQYDRLLTLKQAAVEQVKSLLKSKAIQDTLIDSPNIDKYKQIDITHIDTEKQSPSLKQNIDTTSFGQLLGGIDRTGKPEKPGDKKDEELF